MTDYLKVAKEFGFLVAAESKNGAIVTASVESLQAFATRICADKDALIAMQAEALKSHKAARDYSSMYGHNHDAGEDCAQAWQDSDELVDKAISASAETVAAWKARELAEAYKRGHVDGLAGGVIVDGVKPLRREVAMLRDAIRRVTEANYEQGRYAVTLICQEALRDTQATAEAHDAEVAAKALTKLRQVFEDYESDELFVTTVLDHIDIELRAESEKAE